MRYYYAQNKEDLLIKSFFPDIKNGYYIDVGANHPDRDSVTKLFYDEGWSGINIEPIDRLYKALVKLRPRDRNLHIGVGSKPGVLDFTEYPDGDGLSTFDETMSKYYEEGQHSFPTDKVKKYKVTVKTLSEVVKEEKVAHIHFMKVDVEGFEYEVISGFDWKRIRPELICIEANHISKDWRPILKENDYVEVFFDGINNYYLAKEAIIRKEYFSYPDAVFAGNPVYYPAAKEVEGPLAEKITQLTSLISDKEQEVFTLQKQQRDVRFLMKRLAIELQLRIGNRAQESRHHEGHKYYPDPRIHQAIKEADRKTKDELLTFIKGRDKVNIRMTHLTLREKIKPFFWKIVYKVYSSVIRVLSKFMRGSF